MQSKRRTGRPRRRAIGPSPRHRRLLCEALEPRTLLSVSLQLPGGPQGNPVPWVASPLPGLPGTPGRGADPRPPSGYGSATPAGLTPNQIRGAYGLGSYTSGVLSNGISFAGIQGDGRGQTIAIIDAYDYPTALSDLNAFSSILRPADFQRRGRSHFRETQPDRRHDRCRARTPPVRATTTGRAKRPWTSSGPTP